MGTRGSGNGREARPVGSAVTLGQADRAQLFEVEHQVREALGKMGQLRDNYLKEEARLLSDLEAKRAVYRQLVNRLADEYEVKRADEKWDFSADDMTFTRVG